ncbi:NDP-hexose 2,3-dehydratase family protein [Acidimicrobiaceae bacterium]|nr:NDP-hexose 2,3-dehydratase family protein [Acidimicrobiaceae bacterium]
MSETNQSAKSKKFEQLVNNLKKDFNLPQYESEKISETLMCTNNFYSENQLLNFYNDQVKKNKATINLKNLFNLELWEVKSNKISHNSGKFFEIVGINISKSETREVGNRGWEQPIIKELNNVGGLLGLIRTHIDGLPHYLIEAKFEPGNYNKIQFSPTIQATFSNIESAHGGNTPNYYEIFKDYKNKKNYLFNNWLSEDGGRLYKKRNLGLVKNVNYEDIGEIKNGFIFASLYQLRNLSKKKSIVNPHLMRLMNF